jgi:hypothetical protein
MSTLNFLRVTAQGSDITQQHIDKIRSNCVFAKNTLIQLHASDALLRVNRGQIYESISTKLMDGFNGRVAKNKYNNKKFESVFNNYNHTLDAFRLDYIKYEGHLSVAISTDCLGQPTQFYDAVLVARTDRNQINADIIKLNQYIDQYQLAIEQFEADHQKSNNGTSN